MPICISIMFWTQWPKIRLLFLIIVYGSWATCAWVFLTQGAGSTVSSAWSYVGSRFEWFGFEWVVQFLDNICGGFLYAGCFRVYFWILHPPFLVLRNYVGRTNFVWICSSNNQIWTISLHGRELFCFFFRPSFTYDDCTDVSWRFHYLHLFLVSQLRLPASTYYCMSLIFMSAWTWFSWVIRAIWVHLIVTQRWQLAANHFQADLGTVAWEAVNIGEKAAIVR